MSVSYLSLGSNMGDRKALLDQAIELLNAHASIEVSRVSSFYETAPWGGVEQEAFMNIALKIETTLTPLDLLDACQGIELALNRERIIRWGPRTIDIDLLSYDEKRMMLERLELPHPRMFERAFVLAPLLDVLEGETLYDVFVRKELDRIDDQEIKRLT